MTLYLPVVLLSDNAFEPPFQDPRGQNARDFENGSDHPGEVHGPLQNLTKVHNRDQQITLEIFGIESVIRFLEGKIHHGIGRQAH